MSKQELEFRSISHWELLSDRGYSVNRYSPDGKWLAKIFKDDQTQTVEDLLHQQELSQHVAALGIATPRVGDVFMSEEGFVALYERVHDKQSLARMIANEPSTLPYAMRIFAQELRKLHETPCDTAFFPSWKEKSLQWAKSSANIAERDREFVVNTIANWDDAQTCLIKDAHPGNIIVGAEGTFVIDLGLFGWGSPLIDIGDFYQVCHLMEEELTLALLHLSHAQLMRCWEVFCYEYYGAESKTGRKEIRDLVVPYMFGVVSMLEEVNSNAPRLSEKVQECIRAMQE